jgi:hypothetical protein
VGAGKSTVGYPEAIICQKTFYETINHPLASDLQFGLMSQSLETGYRLLPLDS